MDVLVPEAGDGIPPGAVDDLDATAVRVLGETGPDPRDDPVADEHVHRLLPGCAPGVQGHEADVTDEEVGHGRDSRRHPDDTPRRRHGSVGGRPYGDVMSDPTGSTLPGPASTAADAVAPFLLAVDHVGLAVPDLDEAVRFHCEVLGHRLVHEETNAEQGVREAMIAVGPGGAHGEGAGTMLQLLAPTGPESTIARFIERSGPGLQQLAYRVSDVEAVSALLRERGLRLLYDEPRRGTAGSRINFIHPKDAGGVLVELVEPAG